MGNYSVFCIAGAELQAVEILDDLKHAGIADENISVLFPDHSMYKDPEIKKHTKAPEGAMTGAGTGGLLGGAIGFLAGIGSFSIPGLGPLIAAGPLLAALGGAAVGVTVGGLTGTLVGLGIPEHEAHRFEGKLKEGTNILISVHVQNEKERNLANSIFKNNQAQDIAVSREVSIP